jgi:hypothetical protein
MSGDSTAIGIARVAAALTEMMQSHASPADRAIQAGIDDCMRGVIKAQTSQDANALKCPTAQGPGTGRRVERPPEPGDLSKALLITPAGRGLPAGRGPVVTPGSMEERVLDRMIDNALGPALPKAAGPKAGDEKA